MIRVLFRGSTDAKLHCNESIQPFPDSRPWSFSNSDHLQQWFLKKHVKCNKRIDQRFNKLLLRIFVAEPVFWTTVDVYHQIPKTAGSSQNRSGANCLCWIKPEFGWPRDWVVLIAETDDQTVTCRQTPWLVVLWVGETQLKRCHFAVCFISDIFVIL